MVSQDFYRHFSGKSDRELHQLISETLENPSRIEEPWAETWRDWLLDFSLQYFSKRSLRSITEQCRYVAFTLRYLAAMIGGSPSPYPVGHVRSVMESRPEVIAVLLFDSPQARRWALGCAFDPAASLPELTLEPYQEVTLQQFVQRFEERRGIDGYTFDDSTVAKWSRDLVPELERAVIDHLRKTNQVARQIVIHQTLALPNEPAQENPDGARLVELLSRFEEEPLVLYYGVALKALNDFEGGQQIRQWHIKTLRRTVIVNVLSLISLMTLLAVKEVFGIGGRAADSLRILAGLNGVLCAVFVMILLIIGWIAIINVSEQIARTRTDIQTLEQLVQSVGQSDEERAEPTTE